MIRPGWGGSYLQLINRNIGFITYSQQKKLNNSCVAIFGVGGLGGVCTELFARCGIGHIKLIDPDKFEPTNLNRQIFSFRNTLGKQKIGIIEKFLKNINPSLKIEKYKKENVQTIDNILKSTDVIILAVDKVKACIMISRAARKAKISLVEGWAIPFGNVRVFTKNTPTLEEVYNLPTIGKEIHNISEEEFKKLNIYMLENITKIKGIMSFYKKGAIQRVLKGENPTFAPLVWFTAVFMVIEGIKILLRLGNIALAPSFAMYNPFSHKIPKLN